MTKEKGLLKISLSDYNSKHSDYKGICPKKIDDTNYMM